MHDLCYLIGGKVKVIIFNLTLTVNLISYSSKIVFEVKKVVGTECIFIVIIFTCKYNEEILGIF